MPVHLLLLSTHIILRSRTIGLSLFFAIVLKHYIQDKIVDMATNEDTVWYLDGQYQGGTKRGVQTINLVDEKMGIVCVFEKNKLNKPANFLTICKMEPGEKAFFDLNEGNFCTRSTIKTLTKTQNEL